MKKKKSCLKASRVLAVFGVCAVAAVVVAAGVFVTLGVNPFSGIPMEVQRFAGNWPTANQNYSNTRAVEDSKIGVTNVAGLGLSWSLPIKGISEWGGATTNPVVMGNTAYFQDLKSNVYAVDAKTGKQLWIKEYALDSEGPNGVAVGCDRIFAIKGHFDVVALNMKGNELWSARLTNSDNAGLDIQPVVYGGMVFVSTVPGVSNQNFYKGGNSGVIYALDVRTGKVRWSFDTVDTKDIWGNALVNSGGGAWYPPAVDAKRGLMFWGVGNAAPWPGTKDFPNGTSRPGNNLYSSSIVALDVNTGKLKWYNQVAPHDLFDYDFQISPILATVTIGGVKKDVVIGAGKMGKVVAFDRATGATLWGVKVGTHKNDELTALPAGETEVSPGPLGGVETNMAYSNGIVYVPVVDMTVKYTPSEFVASSFNFGAAKGELVALDAATGQVRWSYAFDTLNVGAATVVGDLVFTATYNGKIYAFNKANGQKVWEYVASGGINSWPAVSGDTIIWPIGLGKTPELLGLKVGGVVQTPVPQTSSAVVPGKGFQQ